MSRQWWRDRRNNLVDNLIVLGVVFVIGLVAWSVIWAGIAGWFSSRWAPLTIPLGLAIVALVVVIAERLSAWRARAPFQRLPDSELRELIQGWLVDIGVSVTEHPTKETGFAFWLHAAPPEPQAGPVVQITCSPSAPAVSLSMFYIVPEPWHAEFDEMTSCSSHEHC